MTTWIFQANPTKYDVIGALRADANHTWVTRQHKHLMRVGDPVFLWLSGDENGIVGTAEIASPPIDCEMPPDQFAFVLDKPNFRNSEFRVALGEQVLIWPKRLSRNRIKAESKLASLRILSAPQGSNFLVEPEEDQVIRELLSRIGA